MNDHLIFQFYYVFNSFVFGLVERLLTFSSIADITACFHSVNDDVVTLALTLTNLKKIKIMNPMGFVTVKTTVGASKWEDVFRWAALTNASWKIWDAFVVKKACFLMFFSS